LVLEIIDEFLEIGISIRLPVTAILVAGKSEIETVFSLMSCNTLIAKRSNLLLDLVDLAGKSLIMLLSLIATLQSVISQKKGSTF
jgi:hypothetical protein